MKFKFAAIAGAALIATLLPASPASAWSQPYGGCDEAWQAPRSQGAQECRDHGWTVKARLVVSPRGIVKYNALPHCTVEDGGDVVMPCTWNIGPGIDGNGKGLAYWISPTDIFGIAHYVWKSNPYEPGMWVWTTKHVRNQLIDRFGHTQRYWRKAIISTSAWDGDTTYVHRPNGMEWTF